MYVKEFTICVDLSSSLDPKLRPRAFFLTHTHSDHLNAFFDAREYLEENCSKIYMTRLSYLFIKHMHVSHEWILKHIEILNMGANIITLPADPGRNLEEMHLTVKVLPASHSLGSVMFLFLTNSLRVLCTGDFRLSESDVEKYKDFQNRNLDAMYVDTTFFNTKYTYFPKRSEIIDVLIKKIKNWLEFDGDNVVGLSTSAHTGYEDVFNEIYKNIKMKVYVKDEKKMAFYRAISDKVIGVTDNPESRLHLCAFRPKADHENCTGRPSQKCLAIRFSAMPWQLDGVDNMYYEENEKSYKICYATHCSYNELNYFINYFNCKNVIGHPEPYKKLAIKCKEIVRDKVKMTSIKRNGDTRKDVCQNNIVRADVVRKLLTNFCD